MRSLVPIGSKHGIDFKRIQNEIIIKHDIQASIGTDLDDQKILNLIKIKTSGNGAVAVWQAIDDGVERLIRESAEVAVGNERRTFGVGDDDIEWSVAEIYRGCGVQ
ncbi:unnamed protein product [Vicia faba]|uniref:Uncharacterized protein n=1 Tax=Vicia faba TaxID=3906 RepID=A0AAV1AKQ9_VICFA|nr:unnamed protein product [Vicia faba]